MLLFIQSFIILILDIIFENDDLIAVNKPAGMVVHPAVGHRSGTLVHAALAHSSILEGVGGSAVRQAWRREVGGLDAVGLVQLVGDGDGPCRGGDRCEG